MKIIAAILVLFINVNFFSYIKKVNEAELLILQLYQSDFKTYMYVDDNYNIRYNLVEMEKYFKDNGYKFKKIEGDLSFIVSFDGVFSWEKRYDFYLEKNNEK